MYSYKNNNRISAAIRWFLENICGAVYIPVAAWIYWYKQVLFLSSEQLLWFTDSAYLRIKSCCELEWILWCCICLVISSLGNFCWGFFGIWERPLHKIRIYREETSMVTRSVLYESSICGNLFWKSVMSLMNPGMVESCGLGF